MQASLSSIHSEAILLSQTHIQEGKQDVKEIYNSTQKGKLRSISISSYFYPWSSGSLCQVAVVLIIGYKHFGPKIKLKKRI